MNGFTRKIDLLVVAIYFLFTCLFFLERTSFLDNPFTLFKLVNDESLFVNANRYPAAIIQILPLLAIKLGIPLKAVMFTLSMSYFLFHGILFSIIRFFLKDKEVSWLLLLTLIIPVAHTFFWNNNELFLGLSTLCYWLALMRKEKWVASLATVLVLAWIHPLLAVIVIFIVAANFVTRAISQKLLLTNGILYAISYSVKSLFFPNYYDAGKSSLLLKNLSTYNFSPSSIFNLISSLDFWPIILCCSASLIVLLLYKKWMLTFLSAGFIICYLILISLTEGDAVYTFYNEGNFRVLFFIAAYALVTSGVARKTSWLKYGIGLMVIVGFVRIALLSSFYSERIKWYQSIAIEHDREVLTYGNKTNKRLVQHWASPFESIVLSTLAGESKTLIFTEDPSPLEEEIQTNKQMITTHGRFLIYNPDNDYFRLQDKSYKKSHTE